MTNSDKPAGTKSQKASKAPAGVDFDNLRAGMCKFPLGGIDEQVERFCGELAVEGSPYCENCAKKAYTRPERRRA